mmetsp:Transcript_32938/g.52688  ORF Transcript_32938/g.52688 Transcript_32938/m.52688 type:complete len:282 (+) Transcript_32938:1427-2272(+)
MSGEEPSHQVCKVVAPMDFEALRLCQVQECVLVLPFQRHHHAREGEVGHRYFHRFLPHPLHYHHQHVDHAVACYVELLCHSLQSLLLSSRFLPFQLASLLFHHHPPPLLWIPPSSESPSQPPFQILFPLHLPSFPRLHWQVGPLPWVCWFRQLSLASHPPFQQQSPPSSPLFSHFHSHLPLPSSPPRPSSRHLSSPPTPTLVSSRLPFFPNPFSHHFLPSSSHSFRLKVSAPPSSSSVLVHSLLWYHQILLLCASRRLSSLLRLSLPSLPSPPSPLLSLHR